MNETDVAINEPEIVKRVQYSVEWKGELLFAMIFTEFSAALRYIERGVASGNSAEDYRIVARWVVTVTGQWGDPR